MGGMIRYPQRIAARLAEKAAALGVRAGRALDIGCAVGGSCFELAKHCEEVVGLDQSAAIVAAANKLRGSGQLELFCAVRRPRARKTPSIDSQRSARLFVVSSREQSRSDELGERLAPVTALVVRAPPKQQETAIRRSRPSSEAEFRELRPTGRIYSITRSARPVRRVVHSGHPVRAQSPVRRSLFSRGCRGANVESATCADGGGWSSGG